MVALTIKMPNLGHCVKLYIYNSARLTPKRGLWIPSRKPPTKRCVCIDCELGGGGNPIACYAMLKKFNSHG